MAATEDRALVLRRHRYGESSLLVHLLTRSNGRAAVLAKGAYRPKSAYYGALDLFDTLEVAWTPGRGSELGNLREARPVLLRRALSRDLARYRAGLAALELCDLAARHGHPDGDLFRALARALDRLAAGVRPELALVAFELHFLAAVGLAPALLACAACGRAAARSGGPAAVSAGAGGRLCPACAAEARASGRRVVELPGETLRIAAAVADADDRVLARYRLAPDALARVRGFVDRFVEYHLETRPRTFRRARARA